MPMPIYGGPFVWRVFPEHNCWCTRPHRHWPNFIRYPDQRVEIAFRGKIYFYESPPQKYPPDEEPVYQPWRDALKFIRERRAAKR